MTHGADDAPRGGQCEHDVRLLVFPGFARRSTMSLADLREQLAVEARVTR